MKTTLRLTQSVFAIAFPVAVFGGLVGILPTAFFAGALFLGATVGFTIIAVADNGRAHRPIIVHQTPATADSVAPFVPARPRVSYGLRRQHCPAA
jgi:hypothetical protein